MSEPFYLETIESLVRDAWLDPHAEVLAVAANETDRAVLMAAGLRSVTISNLDDDVGGSNLVPYGWSFQDAADLSFDDGSFDYGICHQGLHHCRSPHGALLELYRVARRGVVVFEPHDTLLTRVGVRMGVGQRYETAATHVRSSHSPAVGGSSNRSPSGGVQNTEIPNFVYRWSVREARRTLASYDPTGPPRVRCYYDLRVPARRIGRLRHPASRWFARAAIPVARLVLRVVPSQANAVALVIDKLDPQRDRHPWLNIDENRIELDTGWVRDRYDDPPRESRDADQLPTSANRRT
jgi:SAM-dependent methyltransferase